MSNPTNSLQPSTAKLLLVLLAAIAVPVSSYADVSDIRSSDLLVGFSWFLSVRLSGLLLAAYLIAILLSKEQKHVPHDGVHKARTTISVLALVVSFISMCFWLQLISDMDWSRMSAKQNRDVVIAGIIYLSVFVLYYFDQIRGRELRRK